MSSNLTTRPAPPPTDRADQTDRRSWLMLAVLLTGQFMGLVDAYVVTVALPTIGSDLHASGAWLQLVIGGYTVAYAMLLITGARLGALYGRRRTYLLGVFGFTAASLLCALAPGIGALVAFRCVQGAAAAIMVPQIMSVIQLRFTGAARARALGGYALVLSVGAVAGIVLGGLLVSADLLGTGWRPVFGVNVPLGLALLALVPRLVPADRPTGAGRLDLAGLAVAVPAVVLVVLPLVVGHQVGWPAWVFASIAAGVALAVVFVVVERRIAARGGHPLLRLDVLRAPGMATGMGTLVGAMVGYGGFLFAFAVHLQTGLGQSALRAGVSFLPMATTFGLFAYFWRALPARWHPAVPPVGIAVCVLGTAGVGAAVFDRGPLLAAALAVYGAGLGLSTSLLTHALVGVRPAHAADASGLVTTTMQLGQVTGVAVFGTVYLALAAGGTATDSTRAMSATAYWLALLAVVAVPASVGLARAVRRAGPGGTTGTSAPEKRG